MIEYQTNLMFPTQTFTFVAPEKLVDFTTEVCKTMEFRSYNGEAGVGTTSEIQKDARFALTHKWMQSCVDQLHRDRGWACERLLINKTWINRSDANTGHHHEKHRHPMSFLSGILYLQGFSESPTIFYDPVDKRRFNQFYLDGDDHDKTITFPNKEASKGTLIIFPSWLVHGSTPNNSNENRFSIAFNTFPTGNINLGGWEESMANIHVN